MEHLKSNYQTAKERVEKIKGFHQHLFVYVVVNIAIVALRIPVLQFISKKTIDMDEGFYNWLDLNILLTPAIWGLALAVHALYVFKFWKGFLGDWEERKIKELMEQDKSEAEKYT